MELTPESVEQDIRRLSDAMSQALAGGDMTRFLSLSSRRHQLLEWCERSGTDCLPDSLKADLSEQIKGWLEVLGQRCTDIQSEIRSIGVKKRDTRAVGKAYGLRLDPSHHVTNHA